VRRGLELLVRRTEQRVHGPIGILALLATVDLALTLRALLGSGLAAHDADQGIGGSALLCFALLGATISPESLWMYGFRLPDDVLCERAWGRLDESILESVCHGLVTRSH
jgi:hypothetical protein